MSKRIFAFTIILTMLLSLSACSAYVTQEETELDSIEALYTEGSYDYNEDMPAPEPEEGYELGNIMPNFTAVLDDGTELELYELLEKKDAVLINLWGSQCDPCRREFPFMQEAYNEMSDSIGIIALSLDDDDTNEIIAEIRRENSIPTVPMGLDGSEQFYSFGFDAMPASVIVDRFGIICFRETGTMPEKDAFMRLFSVFVGEDYTESILLDTLPPKNPTALQPDEKAMKSALGISDSKISIIEPEAWEWPFVISDKGVVKPSNFGQDDTKASLRLLIEPKAAAGISFDFLASTKLYESGVLFVYVNDKLELVCDEAEDWNTEYLLFDGEDRYNEVAFEYSNFDFEASDQTVGIKNIRLINKSELSRLDIERNRPKNSLPNLNCELKLVEGNVKPISLIYNGEIDNESTAYISAGGKVKLHIAIGEDINERTAYVSASSSSSVLNSLPFDENGYLLELELPKGFYTEYISVCADELEGYVSEGIFIFENEAAVNQMCADIKATLTADESYEWEYTDKTTKGTKAYAKADKGSAYIKVVDNEGSPIEGVMIKLCDETSCQLFTTDAKGMVSIPEISNDYEVHVLKAPTRYKENTMLHHLLKSEGNLTIVLDEK